MRLTQAACWHCMSNANWVEPVINKIRVFRLGTRIIIVQGNQMVTKCHMSVFNQSDIVVIMLSVEPNDKLVLPPNTTLSINQEEWFKVYYNIQVLCTWS